MSSVKVDEIGPRTDEGTLIMGASGDTIEIPAGVTIANAGTATGFGSNILQVKHYSFPQLGSETSTAAWSDTNTTGKITCASTDSKVLVMFAGSCTGYRKNNVTQYTGAYRLRESLTGTGYPPTAYFARGSINGVEEATNSFFGTYVGGTWLHSPNSTSELTYTVQIYAAYFKTFWSTTDNETATMTLMEVGV